MPSNVKSKPLISLFRVTAISALAGVFFSITGPTPGNSLLIILASLVLALFIYAWAALAVRIVAVFYDLSIALQRTTAVLVTVVLLFLIMLQSIGQLSWRDVLIVSLLVVLFYIYSVYLAGNRQIKRP